MFMKHSIALYKTYWRENCFKRSSEQESASNASGLGPQTEVWEGRTPPAYLRRREFAYFDIIFAVLNFLNLDFWCSVVSCSILKTFLDLFLQLESSSSEKTQAIVSDKIWSDKRCWSVEPNSKLSLLLSFLKYNFGETVKRWSNIFINFVKQNWFSFCVELERRSCWAALAARCAVRTTSAGALLFVTNGKMASESIDLMEMS